MTPMGGEPLNRAGADRDDTAPADGGGGESAPATSRPPRHVLAAVFGAAFAVAAVAFALDWGAPARAALIAALCVLLWLTEWVRVWVPTVILWIATPLLLGGRGDAYALPRVLSWSADPVLVLFLGGFTLAAAIGRQGADR
jgi:sodium-dependent dicarboxylate transporter 2/3/5